MDLSALYAATDKKPPKDKPKISNKETEAKRLLAIACEGLPITPALAWKELGEDQAELIQRELSDELLKAFCMAVVVTQTRLKGQRPTHYTQSSMCEQCGSVWLWKGAPSTVTSCPWCFNRVHHFSIPSPTSHTN